ncbi:MAG: 2-C-methyl-D-erythritol 2,4-cyclodiphosphate synthase [Gammaproteobacteria bacterium]|nr:2-C-methyl-D-erythritol 2,4-cyclodiphosphate synthase [Gammaproteobacteria bacterium]
MLDDFRIGHGIDVHRFAKERIKEKPLRLAGITLSENYSLVAHSDGDVILHAICDAILGACAEGDIGEYFSDTDQEYSGIDSTILLSKVLEVANAKKLKISNIDITLLAQVPKISPYRNEMIENLCGLLDLNSNYVNLKATTTERLGYIGREEGIACHCVVLMSSNG